MNSPFGQVLATEIEYCEGTLEFDRTMLEICAESDKSYKGSFRIVTNAKDMAVGNVYTTDYRMTCPPGGFRGRDMEVPFIYDTTGMESGDTAKGEFYIISNMGEYYLPYEVKITGKVMNSELGEIRNLFHFANLAKVNWQEALVCFASNQFPEILTGSGKQFLQAYAGLVESGKENGCMDYAMEQFLILIRKKQPISYSFNKEEITFSMDELPEQWALTIDRNGWGYTRLCVKVEAQFIKEEQFELTGEDFHNNKAVVLLHVDKKRVHTGFNYGSVCFDTEDGIQKCRLVIEKPGEGVERHVDQYRRRQMTSVLMRLYLDYRTGRRAPKECLSLASEILEQVRGTEDLMPALYQAHVKLLLGQSNEAVWLLKHAKRMMEGIEMPLNQYGYFLYLLAMSDSDDRRRAQQLLEQYVVQYPDSFSLYWGYMHKQNLHHNNPGTVYRKLKEFWEEGCFNPILFLETALIVLKQPEVFSVMGRFELQLLLFMDRYDLFAERICDQIYNAAESVKGYQPALLKLLLKHPIKDKKKRIKILSIQYMRGDCRSREAAGILREGIENECRITGLYEAYIRALNYDKGEVLPTEVVKYFAFDSSLDDEHLAYVYAKVMRQQEGIRPEYEEKIRKFTAYQLSCGRIDENLAYLYRNILMPEDMNELMQSQLLKLVFTHVLSVNNSECCNCIVRHEGIRGQNKYAIKAGKAMVQIYSDAYTIMFEDKKGYFNCRENGYELHALLGYERMKHLLKDSDEVSFGEQFYRIYKKPVEQIDNVYEFARAEVDCRRLMQQSTLTDEYRREIAGSLLRAYGRWDMTEDLDTFLELARAEDFKGKDRGEFVCLLCDRAMYKKAFDTAMVYGYEKTDDRVLARLCQYMIEDCDGAYEEGILKLSYYVFEHGKYTESMLEYLIKWYAGTVKQMRKIWKAAVAMVVPATALAERILRQILVTGAYTSDREKIFSYYCEHAGSGELIRRYLSIRVTEYLIHGEEVEEPVFAKLQREMLCGEKYPSGAKLALLKYNSTRLHLLDEDEKELCTSLLEECLQEERYLPFFVEYVSLCPKVAVYSEADYISFASSPGLTVTLNYMIDRQDESGIVYYKEEMSEVYPGIYQKGFRLFWGERVQYYVTQEQGDDEQFIMSGTLERSETIEDSGRGRFRLLNDIALSMELRDYRTAESLMYEYAEKDYITGKLLRIK